MQIESNIQLSQISDINSINPQELYNYLISIEPKNSSIFLEILSSLTMNPCPIDEPENNLLTVYNKYLRQALNFSPSSISHLEFKRHLEILSCLEYVEILNSDSSQFTILDLIHTYLIGSTHENAQYATGIYLEFLEEGILDTYNINPANDKQNVFDREQKLAIINKVNEVLEDFAINQHTHPLFQKSRRVFSQLYLPNMYTQEFESILNDKKYTDDLESQFMLEFAILETLQNNQPILARVFKSSIGKQLENYFNGIEEFYEKLKNNSALHTMAHFSKFNEISDNYRKKEFKDLRDKCGNLRDFLFLGVQSISKNPNDINFFNQTPIINIWSLFDRNFSSMVSKNKNKQTEGTIAQKTKIQDENLFYLQNVKNSQILETFFTLVDSCELLDFDESQLLKKELFKSMTNHILSKKVNFSNFHTYKIFKLALTYLPRSVNFANYFVQIKSQNLSSLDQCLEELGELLWADNKIVLFKTWIFWFSKVIVNLTNTIRRSNEQHSIGFINSAQENEDEILYPAVTQECLSYISNMLEYIQVSISTFVESAKKAKNDSTLKKSIYQARVTYSSIVKDAVSFLQQIVNPIPPQDFIEQKLEELVKQCGNNPQNWIFYLEALGSKKMDHTDAFNIKLDKMNKVYRRALNFCKGDIFPIYRWFHDFLNIFGVAEYFGDDQQGFLSDNQYSNVQKLLGIVRIAGGKKDVLSTAEHVRQHFLEFINLAKEGGKGAPMRKDLEELIGKL